MLDSSIGLPFADLRRIDKCGRVSARRCVNRRHSDCRCIYSRARINSNRKKKKEKNNIFHPVASIKIHKERDSALFKLTRIRVDSKAERTSRSRDHHNFGREGEGCIRVSTIPICVSHPLRDHRSFRCERVAQYRCGSECIIRVRARTRPRDAG